MDPTLIVVLVVVLVPVLVLLGLARAASLRGPLPPPPTSRRPVETLVTEAIPEEHPDAEDAAGPAYQADESADSSPPSP